MTTAPERIAVARWVTVGSCALAVVGAAISAYLTYEHYTSGATLACPENGTVSCAKVTSSAHSMFLGVPVALLGLVYFAAVFALVLPWAWQVAEPAGSLLRRSRLLAVSAGTVFVIYLVWAELFRVNAICLWCTAIHVDMVALFAVVLFGDALTVRLAPAD